MISFSHIETEMMAKLIAKLIKIQPSLKLVGVLPGALSFGLTRMWQLESSVGSQKIPEGTIYICKTIEEATAYCQQIANKSLHLNF